MYEREVISIPASGTIDLIYKYKIHAHPNVYKSYPYKKALYYTFRENGGWMSKLFSLDKIIIINPLNEKELESFNLDIQVKERLLGYIEERDKSFKFSNENVKYKFYVFNNEISLPLRVRLPGQNNHAYFTISEIYSGKELVNRSNDDIRVYDEDNEKFYVLDEEFHEGKKVTVLVNKYERSKQAREVCLNHHGYTCKICGFNFEARYGVIGKNIIEVHHKKPLYEIKENYKVNPINDLIPVCSNCHTIIHSRKPSYEIEELKSLLENR